MKSYKFKSEEEFAEIIVKWLKSNGWEVYQEVQLNRHAGSIADIVALKDGKYWIIECKLNFGFNVMSQADEWRYFANYVSVAIPYTNKTLFRVKLCKLLNIGVLTVIYNQWLRDQSIDKHWQVNEDLKALEQELKYKSLINQLTEKHKTFAKAGNNYSKRITPFKLTVEKLVNYVKENNGSLLREVVKKIDHHYSTNNSAKTNLAEMINRDIIKELYLDRKKEGNRVYLKEIKNENN